MIVSLIVAMAKDRAIGKNNNLLWHLADDLKNFKKCTLNKPIIMGRKTFESIGRALPKRENIVLTKNKNFKADGITVFYDLESALSYCKNKGEQEAVIIGGSYIYELSFPYISQMYITYVDAQFKDADTFFPKFDFSNFEILSSYSKSKDENNDFSWRFEHLKKY
ncbi:MAG: dihydrofolate reductase [Bacteriovoracaceae bacterium]|jgi:dihydrofolate reductase|nr:dihydrofolate reductase [Bacteriovoracaceae bacterium]